MDKISALKDKFYKADEMASRYLADGRLADEVGNRAKAERLYAKAQVWADKRNSIQDKLYDLGETQAIR